MRVRVDAAAGDAGTEEMLLDGVDRREAEALQALLLSGAAAAPAGAEQAAEPPRARPHGGALAPARPLTGAGLVASLAAAAAIAGQVAESVVNNLTVDEVEERGRTILDEPLRAALIVVAALLLVPLAAVGWSAFRSWGFVLRREGANLVAERGLVNRRRVSLDLRRLRGWELFEPLPARLARAARLRALVIGVRGDRADLLPVGPRDEALRIARSLVPFDGELLPHPPAARTRRLVRALTLPVLAIVPAGILLGWTYALAPAALAVVLVPLALDRYRALGHAVEGTRIAARAGSLGRTTRVVDVRSVDSLRLTRSLSQRRTGLASLRASVGGPRALVLDAGHGDAVALAHRLLPALAEAAAAARCPSHLVVPLASPHGRAAPRRRRGRPRRGDRSGGRARRGRGRPDRARRRRRRLGAGAGRAARLALRAAPCGRARPLGLRDARVGTRRDGRIELVSLDERPLDRLLGLARVDVHTAGGVLELPPLVRSEALALLAELARRAGESGDDT